MKQKKHILEWDDNLSNVHLIGIVSSTPSLTFVHRLNQSGIFNFVKMEDLNLDSRNNNNHFLNYKSLDEETGNEFKLIKNKGTTAILGKEFKGLDFILYFGSENSETCESILEELKKLSYIQTAFEIDFISLTHQSKKLFEF